MHASLGKFTKLQNLQRFTKIYKIYKTLQNYMVHVFKLYIDSELLDKTSKFMNYNALLEKFNLRISSGAFFTILLLLTVGSL